MYWPNSYYHSHAEVRHLKGLQQARLAHVAEQAPL